MQHRRCKVPEHTTGFGVGGLPMTRTQNVSLARGSVSSGLCSCGFARIFSQYSGPRAYASRRCVRRCPVESVSCICSCPVSYCALASRYAGHDMRDRLRLMSRVSGSYFVSYYQRDGIFVFSILTFFSFTRGRLSLVASAGRKVQGEEEACGTVAKRRDATRRSIRLERSKNPTPVATPRHKISSPHML